jgi:hypothetical protein
LNFEVSKIRLPGDWNIKRIAWTIEIVFFLKHHLQSGYCETELCPSADQADLPHAQSWLSLSVVLSPQRKQRSWLDTHPQKVLIVRRYLIQACRAGPCPGELCSEAV